MNTTKIDNTRIIHSGDKSSLHFGYVYILMTNTLSKIGRTKNWRKRIYAIESGIPVDIISKVIIECDDYELKEKTLHRVFDAFRKKGEWFDLSNEHILQIMLIEKIYQFVVDEYPLIDDFCASCCAYFFHNQCGDYVGDYYYRYAKAILSNHIKRVDPSYRPNKWYTLNVMKNVFNNKILSLYDIEIW